LNVVYGTGLGYLFTGSMYTNMLAYVELVRPVNVVTHYTALMSPVLDNTGNVTTVDGNIQSVITGSWVTTQGYFDSRQVQNVIANVSDSVRDSNNDIVQAEGATGDFFDGLTNFDNSPTAFYNSITRWKLGIGNKGVTPDTNWTALQTVVLSGLVNETRIYQNRVEYEFELPNTVVQAGISEMGLFLANGMTMKVVSTFPNIDLVAGVALRVIVTVNLT